jgi:hypothetical protein
MEEQPVRVPPQQPRPASPTPSFGQLASAGSPHPTSSDTDDVLEATVAREAEAVTALADALQASPRQDEPTSSEELRDHFSRYGWARVPSNMKLRQLSWQLIQLLSSSIPSSASATIAGEVKQTDLATIRKEDVQLFLRHWGQELRMVAESLGVPTASLHVVEPKVLQAAPGVGKQAVHFDCERALSSKHKFSAVLICSNGHNGTALPTFEANDILSFTQTPAEMQSVAHLLEESHYHSEPAYPGDVIFFRQSTPHWGVRNSLKKGNRVVLFSMLTPSLKPQQDAHQVFPWMYMGAAYSWKSEQFARALLAGKEFHPLERFEEDAGSMKKLALNALRKHGLLESFLQK